MTSSSETDPVEPAPAPAEAPDREDLQGLDVRQSLQAALLAAGEPLAPGKLASLVGARSATEVRRLVEAINRAYEAGGRAFYIREVAGGFQMVTRPAFARWLRKRHVSRSQLHLSEAAMETLAIVAYRQPVLRAEIEEIRGVQCGELLRQLMDKDLVRMLGRDESLGRPILYGTTRTFLERFGLRSLDDLPRALELRQPLAGRRVEPQAGQEPVEEGEPEATE